MHCWALEGSACIARHGTGTAAGRRVVLFNDILLVARPEGSDEHGGLVLGRGLIELLTVASVEKPVVGINEALQGLFALMVLPMRPYVLHTLLTKPCATHPGPFKHITERARPVVSFPLTCRSAVSRG
jgi:hypothetical protein